MFATNISKNGKMIIGKIGKEVSGIKKKAKKKFKIAKESANEKIDDIKDGVLARAKEHKPTFDKAVNKIKDYEHKFPDSNRHILNIDKSLQLDNYSCGAQSAFAILKYYGKARSVNNVEKLLGTNETGTSIQDIHKLFRQKGLKVSQKKTATFSTIKESIIDYEAPFLTTIDSKKDKSHYIVVYGFSDNHIYVLDSAIKRLFVRWKKKKFRARWDKDGAIIFQ